MYKTHKLVLLPTEDKNPVTVPFLISPKGKLIKHFAGGEFRKLMGMNCIPHHLYLLSDEKIEDKTWCIYGKKIVQCQSYQAAEMWSLQPSIYKKILATTDISLKINDCTYHKCGGYQNMGVGQCQDCNKTSLPQFSQLFIEHFIKEYNEGRIIEEVEVEYEEIHVNLDEPTSYALYKDRLEINSDNTINIKPIKDSYSREEVESLLHKATLEATEQGESFNFWNWLKQNL